MDFIKKIPTFFLIILLISGLVTSDDQSFVQQRCSLTLELEACMSCIFNDTTRGTEHMSNLTHSVIFCMYSQLTFAHVVADRLSQNVSYPRLSKALKFCNRTLFSASEQLWGAMNEMEVAEYKKAHLYARLARVDILRCCYFFAKYSGNMPIPSELMSLMALAKRFFDIAHVFFWFFLS